MVHDLKKGLLGWYDFKPGSRILYIGDSAAALNESEGVEITCVGNVDIIRTDFVSKHKDYYDSIVCVADFEIETRPIKLFEAYIQLLKEDGVFLLGANNRLGLRYFCGDTDPYTQRRFDGIEDYRYIYYGKEERFDGRCYDSTQIEDLLDEAGWGARQRFSVYSDLDNPDHIYASDYDSTEELGNRIFPMYNRPEMVYIEEEYLYNALNRNEMFHQMANAFLFECRKDDDTGALSGVLHVTSSLDRSREDAFYTILYRDGHVEKRPAYTEGRDKADQIIENLKDLSARGIKTVDASKDGDSLIMPLIDAPTGSNHLRQLILKDKEAFITSMDRFRDIIMASSDISRIDPEDEELFEIGYPDLIPLNSFWDNDDFVIYDQEFTQRGYPVKLALTRLVATFYGSHPEYEAVVTKDEMFKRYGLYEKKDKWLSMERDFIQNLRREDKLSEYHKMHRKSPDSVRKARAELEESGLEYEEIFYGLSGKQLIIFGAGRYAKKFFTRFGINYPVACAVDNSEEKWGSYIYADGYEPGAGAYGEDPGDELERTIRSGHCVRVCSPDHLRELEAGRYRVEVCIKDYISVVQQLHEMGISDYVIYNPNKQYNREYYPIRPDGSTKKYHLGYTAGAFDMFHTGHVNLLRRSKEMCDYLIVGVMSDEAIRNFKKKEPCIPYEDRAAVVASCRYVDEVVEIPYKHGNSDTAWEMYHFDVQFCGSDYIGNEGRMKEKDYLYEHGAVLEILPYTDHISSSKIREQLTHKSAQDNGGHDA